MRRRSFLSLAALLAAGGSLSGFWLARQGSKEPLLLSARDNNNGQHYAVGYRLDGKAQFVTEISQRAHDMAIHPHLPLALWTARRPGTQSHLIDLQSGQLLQRITTPSDRHFYGHALFDSQGEYLYSTENDCTDPGRGVLGVWRFNGSQLVREGELSTHGIGPHQLGWLKDGKTLVIANGGIRTEAESRVEMNLEAMQPSLVLMRSDGSLLSKETLPQPMNSIRHLAIADDDSIAVVQQYMGETFEPADLVAVKRPGQALTPFPLAETQRLGMSQYCASVAIHNARRLLAVTAPRGNRLLVWHLDSTELLLDTHLADCAGIAAIADGFVVTSGQTRCRYYDFSQLPVKSQLLQLPAGLWDNHLRIG